MEGVGALLIVVLVGTLLIAALLGSLLPKWWRAMAVLAALIAFAVLIAEHVRLNGWPDSGDTAPLIIYALFAGLALVPALIGAGLAAWLKNRRG